MVNIEIKLITFFVVKDGEAVYSQKKMSPGLNCGSDHQILIAKFRLKLKKAGKTTRPARYNLNQIPYAYALEMMNRFKGLDLVNSVPEEVWTEVCNTVQEAANKTIPKEKQEGKVFI